MNSNHVPSAGQAPRFHPDTLRQARLRRFGLSSATSRAVAALAFGEPLDEPWCWVQLDAAAAAAIDSASRAHEARL